MTFSTALEILKCGGEITRLGWNGANMYLKLQRPDANSKMTLPYVYMKTVQGDLVPWLASQTDVLSDDWAATEYESKPSIQVVRILERHADHIFKPNEMKVAEWD